MEFWKRSAAVMHAPSLRLGEVTCGFVVLQDNLVFLHELCRFLPGDVALLHELAASLHEVSAFLHEFCEKSCKLECSMGE